MEKPNASLRPILVASLVHISPAVVAESDSSVSTRPSANVTGSITYFLNLVAWVERNYFLWHVVYSSKNVFQLIKTCKDTVAKLKSLEEEHK